MSKWDKLLVRLSKLEPDIRFQELKKILESYGYTMYTPGGGSSHCVFRKQGREPITIPKHEPIKKIYIKMVRAVVEREEKQNDN